MAGIFDTRPILVTGSHRSGSTWTGRMIAHSDSVAYIHEPFNLQHRWGLCRAKFDYWFPYVCKQNEADYKDDIQDCLNFKYYLFDKIKTIRSAEDFAKMVIDAGRFFFYRNFAPKRPLLKDPIALFSAEWLVKQFDMQAVVVIRHPAAFAGSLKKIQWSHPFSHFLSQPLLMNDHLERFRGQLEEFSSQEKSIVEQSILLWNMIHFMILYYQKHHPDWIFIKHEELSKNPIQSFQTIYERLGLSFTPDVQRKIQKYSSVKKTGKQAKKLVRDSKANILSWQKRLTEEEIQRVRIGTQEIASAFYDENDWPE